MTSIRGRFILAKICVALVFRQACAVRPLEVGGTSPGNSVVNSTTAKSSASNGAAEDVAEDGVSSDANSADDQATAKKVQEAASAPKTKAKTDKTPVAQKKAAGSDATKKEKQEAESKGDTEAASIKTKRVTDSVVKAKPLLGGLSGNSSGNASGNATTQDAGMNADTYTKLWTMLVRFVAGAFMVSILYNKSSIFEKAMLSLFVFGLAAQHYASTRIYGVFGFCSCAWLLLPAIQLAVAAIGSLGMCLYLKRNDEVKLPRPSPFDFAVIIAPIAICYAISISIYNLAESKFSNRTDEHAIALLRALDVMDGALPILTVVCLLFLRLRFDCYLLAPVALVSFSCMATEYDGEIHFPSYGMELMVVSCLMLMSTRTVLQERFLVREKEAPWVPCALVFWTAAPSAVILFILSMFYEGRKPFDELGIFMQKAGFAELMIMSAVWVFCILLSESFVIGSHGALSARVVGELWHILWMIHVWMFDGKDFSALQIGAYFGLTFGFVTFALMDNKPKHLRTS